LSAVAVVDEAVRHRSLAAAVVVVTPITYPQEKSRKATILSRLAAAAAQTPREATRSLVRPLQIGRTVELLEKHMAHTLRPVVMAVPVVASVVAQ
jgi:hypothetical protein